MAVDSTLELEFTNNAAADDIPALKPWPAKGDGELTMQDFIARMSHQHAGFKNVTQESLHQLAGQDNQQTEAQDTTTETEMMNGLATAANPLLSRSLDAQEAQRKKLNEARAENMSELSAAGRLSYTAADSLLLLQTKSPETASRARASVGKDLLGLFGLGTINATKLGSRPIETGNAFEKLQFSNGWRYIDTQHMASSLSAASNRLGESLDRESRYWQDIVRVRTSGWSLCKLQSMGVRFGLIDGRRRAVGQLVREPKDGSACLVTHKTDMNLRLRFWIYQAGRLVGRSALPAPTRDNAPLEARILEARNSAVASELWTRLFWESEGPTGFHCKRSAVDRYITYIPIDDWQGTRITVTMESLVKSRSHESSLPNDALADFYLHLMQTQLLYNYRKSWDKNACRRLFDGTPLAGSALARQHKPSVFPNHLAEPFILLRSLRLEAGVMEELHSILTFQSNLASALQKLGYSDAGFVVKTTPIYTPSRLPLRSTLDTAANDAMGLISTAPFRYEIVFQVSAKVRISFLGQADIATGDYTTFETHLLAPDAKVAGETTSSPLHMTLLPLPYSPGMPVNGRAINDWLHRAVARLVEREKGRLITSSNELLGPALPIS